MKYDGIMEIISCERRVYEPVTVISEKSMEHQIHAAKG